ncbi:unnamed protein product [Timema podura]|uniref:Uncharacterized protein n=1 Tax=Timema podura TaxID=61482 RepID=A0ABN7NL12_TIMPD|nr:unnamed protein product [Timema podura]
MSASKLLYGKLQAPEITNNPPLMVGMDALKVRLIRSCQCCYPPYCVQESQATCMPMCSPCMPCPPCMPCMPCMPRCADSGGFNPFPSEEEQRRRFIPYNRPEPPLITSDQVMEVRQTTDPGLAASGNSPGTKYNMVYDYFPPDKVQYNRVHGYLPPDKLQYNLVQYNRVHGYLPPDKLQYNLVHDYFPPDKVQYNLVYDYFPPDKLQYNLVHDYFPSDKVQYNLVHDYFPPDKVQYNRVHGYLPSDKVQYNLVHDYLPPDKVQYNLVHDIPPDKMVSTMCGCCCSGRSSPIICRAEVPCVICDPPIKHRNVKNRAALCRPNSAPVRGCLCPRTPKYYPPVDWKKVDSAVPPNCPVPPRSRSCQCWCGGPPMAQEWPCKEVYNKPCAMHQRYEAACLGIRSTKQLRSKGGLVDLRFSIISTALGYTPPHLLNVTQHCGAHADHLKHPSLGSVACCQDGDLVLLQDHRQGARNRCGSNYSSKDRYKSRELRSSVLLTGCDCKKRNGLQEDCRRRDCGIPECLTMPEPQCLPSGGPGPRKTGGVRGGVGGGGSNGSGGPSSYSRVVGQTIKQCPDCCVPMLCTTVETSIPQPPPPPNMCYKFKLDDPPCVRDWCIPCKQHYKDCNEC